MKTNLKTFRKKALDKIGDAFGAGHYGTVIELCKQHIESDPDSIAVWLFKAKALSELSQYEEAERIFFQIIEDIKELDSTLLTAPYSGLGNLCEREGDYEKAIEWYKKASDLDPDEATYLIYLGIVYFRFGNLAQAEKTLLNASKCKEGCIDEAYYNLAWVLASQEKYEEALKYFKKAVKIDSNYVEAKNGIKDMKELLKLKGF